MKTGRLRREWPGGAKARVTLMMVAAMVMAPSTVGHLAAMRSLVQLRLSGRTLPVASDLLVVVTVERDDENRDLTVMVDSGEYMRSSSEELEGADAARAHQFWFKHLPAGDYTVVARLDGSKGTREVAHSDFIVGGGAPGRK